MHTFLVKNAFSSKRQILIMPTMTELNLIHFAFSWWMSEGEWNLRVFLFVLFQKANSIVPNLGDIFSSCLSYI